MIEATTSTDSLNEVAARLGISRSQAVSGMAFYGLSMPYRQKHNGKFSQATVLRICERLRAGEPHLSVAKSFNCGIEFLRELVAYFPDLRDAAANSRAELLRASYRATVLNHIANGLSRFAIRSAAPTEIEWLTDHDKLWLDANLPSKVRTVPSLSVRRDWIGRDRWLADLAEKVADGMYAEDVSQRITACRILAETGCLQIYFANRNRGRFPATQSVLARRAESPFQYHRRAIDRGLSALQSQSVPLSLRRLRYATWLDPKIIMQHAEYILHRASTLGMLVDSRAAFLKQVHD